ncbi:phosphodiester glycosidase family protein [Candidatus Roizmanbacteria bacterium]|nr:phosphodiester glycosidase family protein [Candidatus Roizmanbacteria bacterium]
MNPRKVALRHARISFAIFLTIALTGYLLSFFIYLNFSQRNLQLNKQVTQLTSQKKSINTQLSGIKTELNKLKSEDQYVRNEKLQADIKAIETTYTQAVNVYEKLLDLKVISKKTDKYDDAFSNSLTLLAKRSYASAEAQLKNLTGQIQQETDKITASFVIPQNVPTNNAPPSSGYSRQVVHTDLGDFLLDIVTADLNSTRVIVDTASDGDCGDNCPVLSLATYASRSGAYAGINGSYFCPASYPSCAGKTNTFDTLLMNKNKTYFNSANNVYSTVPAVIFTGSTARFVGASQEWGRDTGVDAVLANRPMLVSGGQSVFGGSNEAKEGAKGGRSFVGASGSTAYIGVVHNATVGESAKVLATMGIQNALNLDDGGSTALWVGGYKVGPGRDLPNVLLFVRK